MKSHGGCSSVGSSARLWFWMSWVQIPPAAPDPLLGRPLCRGLLIALVLAPTSPFGRLMASPQQYAVEPVESVVKPIEDDVARLFSEVRASKNLPRLSRIGKRTDLRQQTCSAAGANRSPGSAATFGTNTILTFYKISSPSVATSELSWIASVDREEYKRFSVAVWPVEPSESSLPEYWVGIGLYLSAFLEFIDNTMTDDAPRRNDWKKP